MHSDQRSHLTGFDRVPNEWSLDRSLDPAARNKPRGPNALLTRPG